MGHTVEDFGEFGGHGGAATPFIKLAFDGMTTMSAPMPLVRSF